MESNGFFLPLVVGGDSITILQYDYLIMLLHIMESFHFIDYMENHVLFIDLTKTC